MMQNEEMKQTVGSLRISEDVIATIASVAAKEIDGVASLASSPANLKSVLKKNAASKSIKISMNDDVAVIDVYMNLKFGACIPTVSEAIQKSVKDAVQNMTGITVSKVNVFVQGISFATAAAAAE